MDYKKEFIKIGMKTMYNNYQSFTFGKVINIDDTFINIQWEDDADGLIYKHLLNSPYQPVTYLDYKK